MNVVDVNAGTSKNMINIESNENYGCRRKCESEFGKVGRYLLGHDSTKKTSRNLEVVCPYTALLRFQNTMLPPFFCNLRFSMNLAS
jgi:hypothetical protein